MVDRHAAVLARPCVVGGLGIRNELLEARALQARERLPQETRVLVGDASCLELDEPVDVIYQSTVFTSILDPGLKRIVPSGKVPTVLCAEGAQ